MMAALNTNSAATVVTVIICVGNAPQTPLDRIPVLNDELSRMINALKPKLKRNIASRALDDKACPTGLKVALASFEVRGDSSEAHVINVVGTANAHTKDGRNVPLFLDSVVPEGSEIRTEKGARCSIMLPDGTNVVVREDARVALSALKEQKASGGTSGMSRLKLFTGKLWSAFRGGNHNMEVETPTTVSGVRGTEFQVSAEPGSETLGVYDGKVAMKKDSSEAMVPQGMAVVAKQSLGEVHPLPAAPENLLPREGRFKGPAHLRWEPVANAVGYRFELSRDVTFKDVSVDARTIGNKIEVKAAPGRYYWRVFARDPDLIESAPSKLYALDFLP